MGIAGGALVLSMGLGACQVASPVTTELVYNPGEGVMVNLDGFAVRDLQIISQGYGAPGLVSGLAANNGTDAASITVTVVQGGVPLTPPELVTPATHDEEWPPALAVDADTEGDPVPVLTQEDVALVDQQNSEFELTAEIPAGEALQFSEGEAEAIPGILTSGGSLVTLELTSSSGDSEVVDVPVVYPEPDGPFADYDPGPSPFAAPAE